jgi:hypothetical protein
LTTSDAFTTRTDVLTKTGAMLPARDSVDQRIINDVTNKTGHWITNPADVGGWPNLASGSPPVDMDHDGMPDTWELAHGLNPANAADGPQDADGDGYTNLEEFLNQSQMDGDSQAPSPPTDLRASSLLCLSSSITIGLPLLPRLYRFLLPRSGLVE